MSTRQSPRFRVLTAVAVAALVGASMLVFAGIRSGGGDGAQVVLDVDDAVADSMPETVPPLVPTTAPPAPTTSAAGSPAMTTAAAELSPLAELLGPRYSAVPDEIEPRPRPVGLQIETIDVAGYPVREVGLEADGQLEIPDETEIGWYRYGATAGRPGATVLAAHVSWNRTTGPFSELGSVEPGTEVSVTLDDGTTRIYTVTERTMYDKDELPRERIWRNTGPETLVLITCGGDFNPQIRRYRQNIVVYAAPVG